jgi:hypothetical protein
MNKLKKSHTEAFLAEDKFYDNGKPCKHGHLSPSYTSSAQCVVCAKTRRAKLKERLISKREGKE